MWGLEPAWPVISQQTWYPLDHHASPKMEASSPEISNCRLSNSSMCFLTSWQTLMLWYKYPTTLSRSSFDVINILAIFMEYHLKKLLGNMGTRGDSWLDVSIFEEAWWQGCWLITGNAGSSPHVTKDFFQMIFHD